MSLVVKETTRNYNGFNLKKPVEFKDKIIVLTGKNGSGKTRFLESLQHKLSEVFLDEQPLNKDDIKLLHHNSLTPNSGISYNNIIVFQNKITDTLKSYNIWKRDFDLPLDQNKVRKKGHGNSGLDYKSLYNLCAKISDKLKKPASDLSHDDIKIYFKEPLQDILVMQNMASICNQYIERKHQNEFNEWKCKEKNVDIEYLSTEDFLAFFGEPPWIIFNKILTDIFEEKFQFEIPDEQSLDYTYQAKLIQNSSTTLLEINSLSSGEKTLLWLSMVLFNIQYCNPEDTKSPKLLLIDEPDASLHPKMVVKMYKMLKSFNENFNSTIIISTHSPTTVALAPSDNVYIVEDNEIILAEKDSAIAELLDGVTQISINPENRRQVFVESHYDAYVYQEIYNKLAKLNSELIDPKISLTFVSSGSKMPEQQIKDAVKKFFKIPDDSLINDFIQSVNGVGSCSHVIGEIETLTKNGNKTVRGIIDRDKNNTSKKNIAVLGENYAYTIENIALDPICVMLLLHMEFDNTFKISDFCDQDIFWRDWLKNPELLQKSVDYFILKVLGRENKQDAKLIYFSGLPLETDSEYLNMPGHSLEKLLLKKYSELKKFNKQNKKGELKKEIVSRSMIKLTDGDLIPKEFETVLFKVQK